MKYLLALASLLVLTVTLTAQDAAPAETPPPDPAPSSTDATDPATPLTAEQLKWRERMEKYDLDRDGVLNAEEKKAMRAEEARQKAAQTDLKRHDLDGDGKLSPEELASLEAERESGRKKWADRLAKFDANKDGKLDDAEKAAMRTAEKAAVEPSAPAE